MSLDKREFLQEFMLATISLYVGPEDRWKTNDIMECGSRIWDAIEARLQKERQHTSTVEKIGGIVAREETQPVTGPCTCQVYNVFDANNGDISVNPECPFHKHLINETSE